MNFIAFPVGTTNIFPLANSSSGGQLLSEFNIRSRESVDTDSTVKYFIGKSFVHAPEDFAVYTQRDGYDNSISNTTIQIQPGRAVLNGHYVESLAPINIDLNDANYLANKEGMTALKGDLAVGLRMAYSTYQTLAGSALIENADDYYDGVQVVVLPKNDVKLPHDVPGETEFTKINMHLLLATFSYKNGIITSVKQNDDKIRCVDAERIANINDIISGTYVSKANLDPNKIYTFAGKSSNGVTIDGRDTWCDSTDSLMVWDKTPQISPVRPSSESHFIYDTNTENCYLVTAHKQVDGMKNTGGQYVYYQDKRLELPSASFDGNTGGVVTPAYTSRIKEIRDNLDRLYRLPGGHLKGYVQELNDINDLPEIDVDTWETGDYVVVAKDYTVEASVEGRPPSTLYMVGPGYIQTVQPVDGNTGQIVDYDHLVPYEPPTQPLDPYDTATYSELYAEFKNHVPTALIGGVQLATATLSDKSEQPLTPENIWPIHSFSGQPNKDYFVGYYSYRPDLHREFLYAYYYVPTSVKPTLQYNEPIWITGGVPYATEDVVGGFLNVSDDAYGGGYVRLDDTGHLKLMDYELLLTGVLAYQLGEDHSEGSGLTIEEIQSILEEEINDRVCFPNATQKTNAEEAGVDPSVIHLYLELPEDAGTIAIHDIGSRYGSSLYVHISGEATSATTIMFSNCDKLRIDPNISGAPTIVLDKVNLFYDADLLDKVATISNMTLWYERYDTTDPDLQVAGMTVTLVGRIETTENIDPWDSNYANDNHYAYALRSLTFAGDGSIINVGLLVGDSTTANIDEGKSVFATEFTLPQSVGIGYPATKMTHRIKVTGTFVSHYYIAGENAYMMKQTDFSAITQKYNTLAGTNEVGGTIAFYTDAEIVSHINGVPEGTTVDCWDLNTPHFFTGGVIE